MRMTPRVSHFEVFLDTARGIWIGVVLRLKINQKKFFEKIFTGRSLQMALKFSKMLYIRKKQFLQILMTLGLFFRS